MIKYVARIMGLVGILLMAGPVGVSEAQNRVIKLTGESRVGRMQITLGTSESVRVNQPFAEIVVGDPETADVNPLTDQSLYVLGRKIGLTNVALFDASKKLVGVIDVEVTHDLSGLRDALKKSLPHARLKVRSINGRIMLEGMVQSAPAAERAMSLARDFAGDDKEKVTNALSVASNQQVNLEVRFVEVNRTAGKDLGVNWGLNGSNVSGGTGTGPSIANVGLGALSNSLPFGAIVANVLSRGINADVLITALEQKKLARRLAEPNLTALSGESASFHAGGEFPIPISQDDGKIQIEFKEFGVKLDFTPVVLDDGLINLKVRPEVSEIDAANSIRFTNNSVLIPGLSVRKASTSVELRDGQSFAIAGLLQTVNSKTVDQIPWLGNVPVLGSLFRSSAFQKRETDLVIIVTARLARPVGNREQLQTPLDQVLSSNEPEFFLLGKTEVSKKQLDKKFNGVYGHIIDVEKVNYGTPNK